MWLDWGFVNLNDAAAPIEDFVAPLQRHLGGLDLTRIVPLGLGCTAQRRAVYSLRAEAASPEQADELARLWCDVHVEDQVICERLQEGRVSAVGDGGGLLSPHWEDAVRSFQERVVSRLR